MKDKKIAVIKFGLALGLFIFALATYLIVF